MRVCCSATLGAWVKQVQRRRPRPSASVLLALPRAIGPASVRILAPIALSLKSNDFATILAGAAFSATPIDHALVMAAAGGAIAARQRKRRRACRVEGLAGLISCEIASDCHIRHAQGGHRPIASGSGNRGMPFRHPRRPHVALAGVAQPQYHEYRPEDRCDHEYRRHVLSGLADLP